MTTGPAKIAEGVEFDGDNLAGLLKPVPARLMNRPPDRGTLSSASPIRLDDGRV